MTLNDIFIQSPGDFLYFLVVMILSLISLVMSLQLRDDDETTFRRYFLALVGIVFAWSLLFVGVVFIHITNQSALTILPPLERAVSLASLTLLAWAFLTAEHNRHRQLSNSILLTSLLLIALAYTVTGFIWIDQATVIDFNLTSYGLAWAFFLLAVPLFAILFTLILITELTDVPLKLLYFLLITLGAGMTLYQMTQQGVVGNYTGIFRLAFTLAQIILPLIVYRMVVTQYENDLISAANTLHTPVPVVTAQPITAPEPARSSVNAMLNAQLLKAMGMILQTGQPHDIPNNIVMTILDLLKADIGGLLRLQDANYADISVVQDRLMGRDLTGMSLNLENQPTLVNAIERRTQRGLYPDRNMEELDDLYTRLDVEQIGPVYYQPLTHNREIFAVILVALPYTKRELRPEEIELLKGIGAIAGSLLELSYVSDETAKFAEDRIIQAMIEGVSPDSLQSQETLQARRNAQQRLSDARQEIQTLSEQVTELNVQLNSERGRIAALLGDDQESLSISQRIVAITDDQLALRDERDQLTQRLQEAETALQTVVGTDQDAAVVHLTETLKREIEILEAEKIRLQDQLAELRQESSDELRVPDNMQRLLNRMMQEKSELEQDRIQLNDKLGNIYLQLQELGIQDQITGISQWISTISQERSQLQDQNEQLQRERQILLQERQKFSDTLDNDKERDARIAALQDKIEKLAADRETAIKQRDKLRHNWQGLIDKLNSVKEHRARLVAQVSGFEIELNDARDEQAQLRAQIQELADTRSALIHERDRLIADKHALTTELEQVLSQLEGDPARMKQVNQEGLGSLRDMVNTLSEQRDQLQHQLNQTQMQLADVQKELKDARIPSANGLTAHYEPNHPELLVGLAQELRTPMTSITGYIDLLLAESAGILGEMQRKFLKRVSANITRLDTMIDSLVNVTQMDTGNYRLQPQSIDFVHLIEQAITDATVQFREKSLAVTLDLQDELPRLNIDQDAMKQVINQLLTNAYLVSPPASDLMITVVQQAVRLSDEPEQCIYVAIQDSGGGIDPEDMPRVFARKYRADNPLIQGLSDTGVGMSFAKAIIEMHDGKLWIESQRGIGSTFIFAIPIASSDEQEEVDLS